MIEDDSQLSQNSALTQEQRTLFEQCKAKLDMHLRSFVEAGLALTIIRDKRLYRETYLTFEAFCNQEYSMERAHAYRLIDGAQVAFNLSHTENSLLQMSPIGDIQESESLFQKEESVRPTSEGTIRPLTKLRDPEQQRQAWKKAIEVTGGKPTAKAVEQAVQEIVGFQPKSKSPSGKKGCDISRPSIESEDYPDSENVPEKLEPVPFTEEEPEEEEAEEKEAEESTCNWNRDHGKLEYRVAIADSKVGAKIECNARSRGSLPQTIVALGIEALEAMPEKERRITELTLQVRALVEENATLNQVVQEKDTQFFEFKQTIAQRDSRLAELEQAIAQKPLVIYDSNDSRVVELEQTLSQRDSKLAEVEEQLATSEYYSTQASLKIEALEKELAANVAFDRTAATKNSPLW